MFLFFVLIYSSFFLVNSQLWDIWYWLIYDQSLKSTNIHLRFYTKQKTKTCGLIIVISVIKTKGSTEINSCAFLFKRVLVTNYHKISNENYARYHDGSKGSKHSLLKL